MDLQQEILDFEKRISERIDFFFLNKTSFQSGLDYFNENCLDFFCKLQPIGQNLLNKYEEQLSKEERSVLARTLQRITEEGILELKKRLVELP